MAEQEQKPKKRGIVKRVCKWIGFGLLTLLLAVSLIFQAPCKVTLLLFILFLACTILPRRLRKWFRLSVAAVVIVLITWVFLPDENGGWQPYKYNFDEELAAIEAKYVIPDELNAATIYNKLLQDYDEEFFYFNLPVEEQGKLPMREPWLSKDYPELAEWLKDHEKTITKLLEAPKIEKCMFKISDPENFEKQINRNATMRKWAFLLISAANNDIAEGCIKEFLQKSIALLQMGNHLCQQSATTDFLVGMAIRAIALPQFKKFIITDNPEEIHLIAIEEAFGKVKHNWNSDLIKILEYDKQSIKKSFARYYEINQKGKIRFSRDPDAQIRARWKQQLENNKIKEQQIKESIESFVYPTCWQRKLIKAQTILLWFYLPSSPEKSAELIDRIYQKYYQMTKPDFDWTKQPRELPTTSQFKFRLNLCRTIELLAGASDKLYYRTHKIHLRFSTDIRASQLIVVLRYYKEKYGHWPKNLDAVKPFAPPEFFVDPMNGSSFVYKVMDDSFMLYSKGENNIDEGGEHRLDRRGDGGDQWGYPQTGADDWLIWPPRSRKIQKESTHTD
jgi:hypothetical protein